MKDEIKEILEYVLSLTYGNENAIKGIDKVKDYITNLQEENTKLKQKLNCKEYFSSTMPENTKFVILTKENYDRQQKDIQLELIEAKLRIDKAIEYIKENCIDDEFYINLTNKEKNIIKVLDILKGEDEK